MWAEQGLNSLIAAHGINTAIEEGGVSPETALEIAPLTQLARPMYQAGKAFVGPATEWASEGMEMLSNSPLMGKIVTPKVGWYGRAAFDGITNPIGTYKAVKDGRYIHDIASLKRNMRTAREEIASGIKSTNDQYLTLTGFYIPETPFEINRWSHFKPGIVGYFSNADRTIHKSLTNHRFSNIRSSTKTLRNVGGHEQAHAASRYLMDVTRNPRLRRYDPKTDYFVPNTAHPIADKYQKEFMKALNYNKRNTTMIKALLLSVMLFVSIPTQNVIAQPQPKRCEATTKKGTRCKNNAVNNTKYCQVHQAKSPSVQQCKAKTKSGTRCSREAKTSGYCTQHYKMYLEGKI